MVRAGALSAIAVLFLSLQNQLQLRVNVEIVLVPTTVTNSLGQYVADLEKGHFQVWEDDVEQEIRYLSAEDAPMTLGIVLDTSGSMNPTLEAARNAGSRCGDVGTKDDEYFLVLFASKAELATDFTTDFTDLRLPLLFAKAKGNTALYDAIQMGLTKLKDGINPRKALLVISDGYENSSRISAGALKRLVRETDIQVFSIGNQGDGALREMTQLTGGQQFRMAGGLGSCGLIARELKHQYVLAYQSTNTAKDGRWRDIQVKVNPPPGISGLKVRSKRGYTAVQ
jgi:Ca-activated chloride channel family protein